MNEKKRAALTVGAVNDGNGQILLRGFKPKRDFIMEFEPAQGTIASILSRGKDNALTAREISRIMGISFRRVTLRICAERRAGAPILSDCHNGFWLAEDEAEVRRCINALHARAAQIHKTARALEKLL